MLASCVLGFDINYGEPHLFRPWLGSSQATEIRPDSPFIVVLEHTSLAPHVLPMLFSAVSTFSAWSAANSALYMASRTLFNTARVYGSDFLTNTIGRTNSGYTPLTAICCCSLFCLIALSGVDEEHFDQPMLTMSACFVGSMACMCGVKCVVYLRFKKRFVKTGREWYTFTPWSYLQKGALRSLLAGRMRKLWVGKLHPHHRLQWMAGNIHSTLP